MAKTIRADEYDCISSIAHAHGFFPDSVWDHPKNEVLHNDRTAMSILHKGDRVFLPDKRLKHISVPTDACHTFRRRGVPSKFRLQLLKHGRVRAGVSYRLEVDGGTVSEGESNDEGLISIYIPSNARKALLYLDGSVHRIQLRVGRLAPIDQPLGVSQRLMNLGFLSRTYTTQANNDVAESAVCIALGDFQVLYGLTRSCKPDQATCDLLARVHDCRGEPPAPRPDDDI